MTQKGVVAVSESARRQNPFVRRVICHGVDDRPVRSRAIASAAPSPRCSSSARWPGASEGASCCGHSRTRCGGRIRAPLSRLSATRVRPVAGVTYRLGVDDIELASLYRRAWAYVTPSTYEGFGLPYLEAMACGTPVVATPNPGSVEMLDHGKYGVLAADEKFGDSISSLLSDAQARDALGARGLCRAREYSLTVMLDRYEALLFDLVGAHATRVASL